MLLQSCHLFDRCLYFKKRNKYSLLFQEIERYKPFKAIFDKTDTLLAPGRADLTSLNQAVEDQVQLFRKQLLSSETYTSQLQSIQKRQLEIDNDKVQCPECPTVLLPRSQMRAHHEWHCPPRFG